MDKNKSTIAMAMLCVFISACASNDNRYHLSKDIAPQSVPSLAHIENAQPRYEAQSMAGNKNYDVLGQHYQILQKPENYTETGIASWYGKKFHGHRTSNTEIYDMYSMSAAHKTLPLPSYVEVQNLSNGKKVIVRVNDRGPFHQERLIDLSYAAAAKLDMLSTGTAQVKITYLKQEKPQDNSEWQTARTNQYFVQLAAVSDKKNAQQAADFFARKLKRPIDILKIKEVYRVRLGPFYSFDQTQEAEMLAREHQINEAFVVIEPISYQQGQNEN